MDIDALAQEIRRVDGSNELGAGALAEALVPFLTAALATIPEPAGAEALVAPASPQAAPEPAGDVAEKLGRFGHHPDPAVDFEIEVQSLEARLIDARNGYSKIGTKPEPVSAVLAAIERAMEFRVGGDPSAVAAKQTLRRLEAEARQVASPPAPAVADGMVLVPREVAEIINGAFLPTNPNKLRSAAPETIEAAKQFKAALAAVPASLPDGWVSTPEEPTEEMLDAAWVQTGESHAMKARTHSYMRRYYSAMLAARPAAPANAKGGE